MSKSDKHFFPSTAALPEEQSVENVSDLPDYPNLCTDANELYMPPSDADSTNDEILMAIADQVFPITMEASFIKLAKG